MKRIILTTFVLILIVSGIFVYKKFTVNKDLVVGEVVDSLNGVYVYYNGEISNVVERNVSESNYNIGLKYQCVEFVKRYYYEHLDHKMPDSYGHAKDFFDPLVADGELNEKRDLIQFRNPGKSKPEPDDIIVFDGNIFNKYGHVAIVSQVDDERIEIIQQNPGPHAKSREKFLIEKKNGLWYVINPRVTGWLRKKEK